jgi:hypothetical protein
MKRTHLDLGRQTFRTMQDRIRKHATPRSCGCGGIKEHTGNWFAGNEYSRVKNTHTFNLYLDYKCRTCHKRDGEELLVTVCRTDGPQFEN